MASSKTTRKFKVGGVTKTFKRTSCSKSKTAAKKTAQNIRKRGGTSRVIKSGTAWCVYTGGKSKVRRKKRK